MSESPNLANQPDGQTPGNTGNTSNTSNIRFFCQGKNKKEDLNFLPTPRPPRPGVAGVADVFLLNPEVL